MWSLLCLLLKPQVWPGPILEARPIIRHPHFHNSLILCCHWTTPQPPKQPLHRSDGDPSVSPADIPLEQSPPAVSPVAKDVYLTPTCVAMPSTRGSALFPLSSNLHQPPSHIQVTPSHQGLSAVTQIPTVGDSPSGTLALPQPQAHLYLPQDALHPPKQPLHSLDVAPSLSPADTPSVPRPNTGSPAPYSSSSVPQQPWPHLVLPLGSPQTPKQPLHQPDWHPFLSPADIPLDQSPPGVSPMAKNGYLPPTCVARPITRAPPPFPPSSVLHQPPSHLHPTKCSQLSPQFPLIEIRPPHVWAGPPLGALPLICPSPPNPIPIPPNSSLITSFLIPPFTVPVLVPRWSAPWAPQPRPRPALRNTQGRGQRPLEWPRHRTAPIKGPGGPRRPPDWPHHCPAPSTGPGGRVRPPYPHTPGWAQLPPSRRQIFSANRRI